MLNIQFVILWLGTKPPRTISPLNFTPVFQSKYCHMIIGNCDYQAICKGHIFDGDYSRSSPKFAVQDLSYEIKFYIVGPRLVYLRCCNNSNFWNNWSKFYFETLHTSLTTRLKAKRNLKLYWLNAHLLVRFCHTSRFLAHTKALLSVLLQSPFGSVELRSTFKQILSWNRKKKFVAHCKSLALTYIMPSPTDSLIGASIQEKTSLNSLMLLTH